MDKQIEIRLARLEEKITGNDRRYTEVNLEKEKALKIKETADLAALNLAREIQTYKDEKANELREQISRERGFYASQNDLRAAIDKIEATIKPLSDYISTQQGKSTGLSSSWGVVATVIGMSIALITAVLIAFKK